MALVELRQGDTLNIVWSSVQETPLGVKEVESSFAFSYDDLVLRLRHKAKETKSRRSGNAGARFSRVVALATNALKKGKWSTGAKISRSEVFEKLVRRFHELNELEYRNITQNAKDSLLKIHSSEGILSLSQIKDLQKILQALDLFYS
jgi:hypothetical protein